MPKTLEQNKAIIGSTNVEARFLWSNFIEESNDPVLGAWVDPLTIAVEKLQELSRYSSPVQWTSNMKITTLSHRLYGNTSLWAVILYLNGYLHPDEIPSGAVLQVPPMQAVSSLLETPSEDTKYGKTYTV